MFLTPNVFTVEPAENHLDKIGSQLLRHSPSWVANSGWLRKWHSFRTSSASGPGCGNFL